MRPSHIIILIIVLVIIFGASKLPDVARSIGQSAKILKKEMRELQDDDTTTTPAPQAQGSPQLPIQQPGFTQSPVQQVPTQPVPQAPVQPQQPRTGADPVPADTPLPPVPPTQTNVPGSTGGTGTDPDRQ